MSNEVGKVPGKESGVAASDFVKAPSSGPDLDPGRKNLVQSTSLGNAYGDHGSRCDPKNGADLPGCFLEPDVRNRYHNLFMRLVTVAQDNFKGACTSITVKELLKKEEELHWFTALIMDFGSAFLLGAAAKALTKLKSLGANALSERGAMAIDRGADPTKWDRADALLRGVSDSRIESWAKGTFQTVRKQGQGAAKDAKNADANADKTDVEAFLSGLETQCDFSYNAFVTRALSQATDSEFAVLWEGMQPEHHLKTEYEAALRVKLDEYKNSRVRDIGRKTTKDDTGAITVQRETRVVWVIFPGAGRRLHYQYQQAGVESFDKSADDPGKDWGKALENAPGMPKLPPEFGVIGGETKIGAPVPQQFVELALERSEALYGATPTIDPMQDVLKAKASQQPAAGPDATTNPTVGGNSPAQQGPGPWRPTSILARDPRAPDSTNGPMAYPPGSVFNNGAGDR